MSTGASSSSTEEAEEEGGIVEEEEAWDLWPGGVGPWGLFSSGGGVKAGLEGVLGFCLALGRALGAFKRASKSSYNKAAATARVTHGWCLHNMKQQPPEGFW